MDANYVCHEWRTSTAQFDGAANIVVDPEDRNNHCVAVVVRSKEEAKTAGNAIVTDGKPLADDYSNYAEWDSQFFITMGADRALKLTDKYRVTMRVKADKAQEGIGTQYHKAAGDYLYWNCIGNINFTEEWTAFDSGWQEVKEMYGSADGAYTIAFNLAKGGHNTYYFDDIRIEVQRDPLDEGNAVKGGSFESDKYDKEYDSYWCHEWRTPDAQFDGRANIIVDPANEKNHCAAVVVRSTEEAQAAGNMIAANGAIAGWDSQFFISVGENQALKEGDKIQLKMKIKADVAQEADTQTHSAPGSYMHWACVGNPKFTTEWTEFDSGVQTMAANQAGMYTIAFNLSRGIHNTVYFDDIQVIITRKK